VPTKGKDLVKEFERAGWVRDRVKGSHYIMVKGNQTVSIPVHGSKELGTGLEKKLRKFLKE
jgi:mRNA interferase HicA